MSIAVGIIAGVWLIARRLPGRRLPADLASELSVPGVLGGFIGARLYHVVTEWRWDTWYRVWEGGLGIPGAILGGALGVMAWSKYKGYPITPLFDVVAPALPLAQAIGRVGNWFNQELFGRPLDAFWALEIEPQYRPPGYEAFPTFHPTFLYEALWNLGLCVALLWLDSKRVLKPGRLFLFYSGGYALGRLWIESIRIDSATEILGLRVNYWTMGVVLIVSVVWIAVDGFRSPGEIDPYRTGEPRPSGEQGAQEAEADEASQAAGDETSQDAEAEASQENAASDGSDSDNSDGSDGKAPAEQRSVSASSSDRSDVDGEPSEDV